MRAPWANWLARRRERHRRLFAAVPDEQVDTVAVRDRIHAPMRHLVVLTRPILPTLNLYDGPVGGHARQVFERVTPETGEVIQLVIDGVCRGEKR